MTTETVGAIVDAIAGTAWLTGIYLHFRRNARKARRHV